MAIITKGTFNVYISAIDTPGPLTTKVTVTGAISNSPTDLQIPNSLAALMSVGSSIELAVPTITIP